MIKLNLLPEKVRAAETMRLIVLLAALLYVLAALAVGMKWTQSKARVTAAQAEVDQVNAELNSPALRSTVLAVEKFTQDKADEESKASVVDTYRKQVGLLRLVDALPDWADGNDVWFEHVLAESAKNTVTLEGASLGPIAFARFYGMLENQPLVKGLKMPDKLATKNVHGSVVPAFKLEFSLEVPR
jgi:hypothetical protein